MTAEVVTIRDAASGALAQILVSQGFNCFRLTAIVNGRPVEVIYAPPDFAEGAGRPSRGGIPLMFPFPGRIPGTSFNWEGKTYPLEAGDALGNAIHGFVLSRSWRVIERGEDRVIGQFHAWRDDPSLRSRWPADFRVTASYWLANNVLRGEFNIENPGQSALPCGFGTHPYFRVPLDSGSADNCIVRLPITARWELKDMLPTGRQLGVPGAAELQAGRRFGELKLDDAFTGLLSDGNWTSASIDDPASGVRVTQRWTEAFRECVVYTPPHRQAICIEPLTCVPNCFELSARGIDAGLKVILPGGSLTARVEIAVS
jgi:aldose 1-epimerase